MKFFFVYLLFLNTLLYSQNREKTDSTAYYISLNYPVVHDNNYKEALLAAQKAILVAETNDNIKKQASQNYNLGKLYYDLKKYGYFPRDYSRKQFLIDLNDLNQEELPFKIYKGG